MLPVLQNSTISGLPCDVQGVVIQIGDVGSAVWTLIVAIHAFLLAGRPKWRKWILEKSTRGKFRWVFCCFVWLAVILLGFVGIVIQSIAPHNGPFCKFPFEIRSSLQIFRQSLGGA